MRFVSLAIVFAIGLLAGKTAAETEDAETPLLRTNAAAAASTNGVQTNEQLLKDDAEFWNRILSDARSLDPTPPPAECLVDVSVNIHVNRRTFVPQGSLTCF